MGLCLETKQAIWWPVDRVVILILHQFGEWLDYPDEFYSTLGEALIPGRKPRIFELLRHPTFVKNEQTHLFEIICSENSRRRKRVTLSAEGFMANTSASSSSQQFANFKQRKQIKIVKLFIISMHWQPHLQYCAACIRRVVKNICVCISYLG